MEELNKQNSKVDSGVSDLIESPPEEIVLQIKERLVEESDEDISVDDIQHSWSLRDDLGMDSMQAVSLSLDLEDAFSISLDDNDLVKLDTVGDLLGIVQSKLAQKTPG